jgi:hypothetical protein
LTVLDWVDPDECQPFRRRRELLRAFRPGEAHEELHSRWNIEWEPRTMTALSGGRTSTKATFHRRVITSRSMSA